MEDRLEDEVAPAFVASVVPGSEIAVVPDEESVIVDEFF